jgi:hypothetical protein
MYDRVIVASMLILVNEVIKRSPLTIDFGVNLFYAVKIETRLVEGA